MARLRPVVIPAAVVVLAATATSADARARRPVLLPTLWVATHEPALSATEHAGDHSYVIAGELTALAPLAGLEPADEATAPGGLHAASAAPPTTAAAGRTVTATARGPPSDPAHAAGGRPSRRGRRSSGSVRKFGA
jgi:hypothetical protein